MSDDAGNGGNTDNNANDGGQQSGGLFTQEQVDAIIADRLNRERAKFGDYDDIKSQLQKLKDEQQKKADEEKSELEKAQGELNETKGTLATLQQQLETTRYQRAIEREAVKLNFVDPTDAFALVDRGLVKIEEGKVVGADEAIKKLAEAKPHLLTKKEPPNDDSGAQGGGDKKDDEKYQERLRQRFGISV
jgi:predicted transcriptional regulator